jgi:imipenem/basic amino acid-specific outer membrane pore
MKRALTFGAASLASVMTLHAADDLGSMFAEGTAGGEVRLFYIDRDYSGFADAVHRNATSLGGKLLYNTGTWNGFGAGVGFYTTNRIFQGLERDEVDPSLFKTGLKSYSILGEADLQYGYSNTTLVFGRQRLDTPMIGSDDARSLPTLFEAFVAVNRDVPDTTLMAAHVTRIAPGTFANAYNGGVLGVTSGYTAVTDSTAKYQGEFTDMGSWAFGESTGGVTLLSATYTGIEGMKLQAWDYYAWDILNAFYLQADYGWNCRFNKMVKPYVATQLIKENSVGDKLAGTVESLYWGVKAGIGFGGADLYGAYSQNDADADTAFNGATLTPWGGMPAFTQGMATRHMFMAGTVAWKAAGSYDFKHSGINLNASLYYTLFEMDELNGYVRDTAWTASEYGFDLKYRPETVENLMLRFRGNFPREFKAIGDDAQVDWDEYRLIICYNF